MNDVQVNPVVEVVKELPPPPMRAQSRFWSLVIEQVRENAGDWCRVPGVFDPSTATHLRKGRNIHVDPATVEIQVRYGDEVSATGRRKVTIFLRVAPDG